jgi:hypothetical protein
VGYQEGLEVNLLRGNRTDDRDLREQPGHLYPSMPDNVDHECGDIVEGNGPGRNAAETSWRWCRALSRKDFDALMSLIDPSATLHTPVTDQFRLQGHAEISALVRCVFMKVDYFNFHMDVGSDEMRVVAFHSQTMGFQFEEIQMLHINENHLIDEVVLTIRPAAGVAAVLYGVGAELIGRNRSLRWRMVFRPLLYVIAHVVRFVDRKILVLAAPPMTGRPSGRDV